MKRDYIKFPDDENGDVLWRMLEDGDNLSKPREIDFSVIFPTEEAALQFAVHLLRNDHKVSFSEYEEHDELPWQVHAHPIMEPTHENKQASFSSGRCSRRRNHSLKAVNGGDPICAVPAVPVRIRVG